MEIYVISFHISLYNQPFVSQAPKWGKGLKKLINEGRQIGLWGGESMTAALSLSPVHHLARFAHQLFFICLFVFLSFNPSFCRFPSPRARP